MPSRRSYRRRNSAATAGSSSIRPRRTSSCTRLRGAPVTASPSDRLGDRRRAATATAGLASDAHDLRSASRARRPPPVASSQSLDGAVPLGDLEGGLGVAPSGAARAWPSVVRPQFRSAAPVRGPATWARNSSTSRRSRSSFIVSPTTLPAARSARSATWRTDLAERPLALRVDLGDGLRRAAGRSPRVSRRRPGRASHRPAAGRGRGCRSPRDGPRPASPGAGPRRPRGRVVPHPRP